MPLKDIKELAEHLCTSGEANLLANLAGQSFPLKPCWRCKGSIITIRSAWEPDLLENPSAGEWGESKPIPPFYAECKSCTLYNITGLERNTIEEAIEIWNSECQNAS